MFMKLLFFMIFAGLPLLLLIVNILVSMKYTPSRSMLSSFECGFDTFQNARSSFSLHFFLIAIIFLVFDLEIIFLLPMPIHSMSVSFTILAPFTGFLVILFLGTLHEWNEGSLKWF